jgi:putative OPT family oligopeptide transporter
MAIIYFLLSHDLVAAIISAVVMTIAGFFFAAVAGYLVGLIGSSNNPISGLTLSTLIIAALLLVFLGVPEKLAEMNPQFGLSWAIGAVLGVASVVCCSCGVAGDMMQDLKVGHILGGTPWKMQTSEIFGVIGAALVMALPLIVLHETAQGGIGGPELPAPQAGLMAMLSQGIIGGKMAWPLVILGMMFSIAMILIKSPSPMLIAIGMYLPLHTTFAIFVGGMLRAITNMLLKMKKVEGEARDNAENTGTLLASGFIAGEALMAIILAGFVFFGASLPSLFENPGPELGLLVLAVVGGILIWSPLKKGKAEAKE